MTRWAGTCFLLLGIGAFLALGAPPPSHGSIEAAPAAEAKVESERTSEGLRIAAGIPGTLLSVTTAALSDGRSDVYLLVAATNGVDSPESDAGETATTAKPASGPDSDEDAGPEIQGPGSICRTKRPPIVSLWRLRPGLDDGKPKLERIRADLPVDAGAVDAADLDGDGRDELLIARPGQLLALRDPGDPSQSWISLAEDPGLEISGLSRKILLTAEDGSRWLAVNDVGRARFYRAPQVDPEANVALRLAPAGEVQTRTEIGKFGGSILASSPALHAAGIPRFATTPRVVGDRVRVDRIDPTGETVECWGRLPERETVLEPFIRMLDGEPVAVLTTMQAAKLNLFGEKRIRIFPLRADRSKTGHSPLLAAETRINIWQSATPHFIDVDRDGRTDLVLGYWKGLKDDRIVLDVYPRNIANSFSLQPRSTSFDVKDGHRGWLEYGEDLTGDGVPDLLLRSDEELLLYPGRSSLKEIVRRKAGRAIPLGPRDCDSTEGDAVNVTVGAGGSQSIDVSGGSASPTVVDLDGDGLGEVLLPSRSECGMGRLRIFSFSRAGSP